MVKKKMLVAKVTKTVTEIPVRREAIVIEIDDDINCIISLEAHAEVLLNKLYELQAMGYRINF